MSASGDVQTKWRLRLNNLLQKSRHTSQALQWNTPLKDGPDNNCYWSLIAYISGVEYGRARERTVAHAKEVASFRAWRELYNEMYGTYPPQPFTA